MRTAVILPTWNRPQTFAYQLKQFSRQTVRDFDLIVTNANREHDQRLQDTIASERWRIPVHFRADSNDRYGFRRFDIARELSYDRYIFIDDDVQFPRHLIATMLAQYEPLTYHSWFAFQITGGYHQRLRVQTHRQPIHYAGTGVAMIDRAIVDRPELFDFPPAALYIEDLWLTYVVDYIYKWPIKLLKIDGIQLGGNDDVAMFKQIQTMDYRKTHFLEDLRATGWDK
jgi:glycosyltransferase involved in cell wall biosynthesis